MAMNSTQLAAIIVRMRHFLIRTIEGLRLRRVATIVVACVPVGVVAVVVVIGSIVDSICSAQIWNETWDLIPPHPSQHLVVFDGSTR